MRTATNKKAVTTKVIKSTKPPIQKVSLNKIAKTDPKPASKATIKRVETEASITSSQIKTDSLKAINKQSQIITLLQSPNGANIEQLMQATGWQAHSIRGFISGTLRKKRGLIVSSEIVGGQRSYHLMPSA